MKQLVILFTSVGRRVELVQQFRKAADRLHKSIKIIGADLATDAPALFYCDEQIQVCRIHAPEYIPQLLSICKEKKVDLLIPTIDTDLLLLSKNRQLFEDNGTKVLISAEDKIAICRDKRFTSEFFVTCGVKAPMPVDKVEDYKQGFPAFIKPKDGSSSINAYKVNNEQDLLLYSQKIEDYIIQPFVEGKEYTIDVLCDFQGNPIYITPRERVAVRSGEVLKTKIVQDPVMVEECQRIIRGFSPVGPITVQFIQDCHSGENYYIEINPRFGGGAPLSMMAGADGAQALLRLLDGEMLAYCPNAAADGAIYSRFDQCVRVDRVPTKAEVEDITGVTAVCEAMDAVIFDMDDTLYPEKDYIRSGYKKVAQLLPEVEDAYGKLWKAFEEGKPAIDQVLNDEGVFSKERKEQCLECYRNQVPDIALKPEVVELLQGLRRSGKKLGIITDGRVEGQKAKIQALGLEQLVDEIIITDELAGACGDVRDFRKPNTIAFQMMQMRLGTAFDKMVYVGDNDRKDFIAPRKLGMHSIYFRNKDGIYYHG